MNANQLIINPYPNYQQAEDFTEAKSKSLNKTMVDPTQSHAKTLAALPSSVAVSAKLPIAGMLKLEEGVPSVSPQVLNVRSVFQHSDILRADLKRRYLTGRRWEFSQGERLQDVFYRWSERAGVHLVWDMSYDYIMQDPLKFDGTFERAVRTVLDQYVLGKRRLAGVIHQDSKTEERYLVIRKVQ